MHWKWRARAKHFAAHYEVGKKVRRVTFDATSFLVYTPVLVRGRGLFSLSKLQC